MSWMVPTPVQGKPEVDDAEEDATLLATDVAVEVDVEEALVVPPEPAEEVVDVAEDPLIVGPLVELDATTLVMPPQPASAL